MTEKGSIKHYFEFNAVFYLLFVIKVPLYIVEGDRLKIMGLNY